jgi:transposase-like protein
MATYRRYDKKQKLSVVMAAEISGVTATAEATGIPHQTISYWMERPEFSEIRRKTREDLAEEIKAVSHLAWQRTAEALQAGTMEPRDVLFAAEKATTLELLMSGEATGRTETRNLAEGFDDHELATLRRYIQRDVAAVASPQAAVVDPSEGQPAPT